VSVAEAAAQAAVREAAAAAAAEIAMDAPVHVQATVADVQGVVVVARVPVVETVQAAVEIAAEAAVAAQEAAVAAAVVVQEPVVEAAAAVPELAAQAACIPAALHVPVLVQGLARMAAAIVV
jgi:hypothetical protein